MKKFSSLALTLTLLLAACAGGASFSGSLQEMRGRPLNDAVIRFGPPTGQYEKGDVTTYVWQGRKTESVFGPAVTSGRGYRVGHPSRDGHEFLWSGIEYYTCVLRVGTRNGIITSISQEGNPGGCETVYGGRAMPIGKNADDAR